MIDRTFCSLIYRTTKNNISISHNNINAVQSYCIIKSVIILLRTISQLNHFKICRTGKYKKIHHFKKKVFETLWGKCFHVIHWICFDTPWLVIQVKKSLIVSKNGRFETTKICIIPFPWLKCVNITIQEG